MVQTVTEVDRVANQGIDTAELEATRGVLNRMRANLRDALANR